MALSATNRALRERLRACPSMAAVRAVLDAVPRPWSEAVAGVIAQGTPRFDDVLIAELEPSEAGAINMARNRGLTPAQRDALLVRVLADYRSGFYQIVPAAVRTGRLRRHSAPGEVYVAHLRGVGPDGGPSRISHSLFLDAHHLRDLSESERGELAARAWVHSHGDTLGDDLAGCAADWADRDSPRLGHLEPEAFAARLRAAAAVSLEAAGALFLANAGPVQWSALLVEEVAPHLHADRAAVRAAAGQAVGVAQRGGLGEPSSLPCVPTERPRAGPRPRRG